MKNNEEFIIVNIPFFKKLWISITKYERYPEMAAEGVGKAITYFIKLMLIFALILSSCLIYNFHTNLQQGIKYLDENISEINYKDGLLEIKPVNKKTMNIKTDIGNLIVDTSTKKEDTIREYEKSIENGNLGIIWLNNKVIFYANGVEEAYHYEDILSGFQISQFNKTDLINYFTNNRTIYIACFSIMFIATFIAFFIITLVDILILSIFGLLTSYMTGIKIRYRAVFNMSVYSLTISIILKLVYLLIGMYTDFTIKYFDFMYTAIGYICLVAAIFMIKSDVIKQQIELIKLREEKKKQIEENNEEKEKEEEKADKEKKEENEKDKKEEEHNEPNEGTENQGSHA